MSLFKVYFFPKNRIYIRKNWAMSPLHIFKYDADVRQIEKLNCIPLEPLERYDMSTTNNNVSENENNVDQLSLDSRDKRTKNTLIEANQSKEVTWWINELDSLGIKKSSNNNKNNESNIQELEDDADEIKQTFIHNYKNCYNESQRQDG